AGGRGGAGVARAQPARPRAVRGADHLLRPVRAALAHALVLPRGHGAHDTGGRLDGGSIAPPGRDVPGLARHAPLRRRGAPAHGLSGTADLLLERAIPARLALRVSQLAAGLVGE